MSTMEHLRRIDMITSIGTVRNRGRRISVSARFRTGWFDGEKGSARDWGPGTGARLPAGNPTSLGSGFASPLRIIGGRRGPGRAGVDPARIRRYEGMGARERLLRSRADGSS